MNDKKTTDFGFKQVSPEEKTSRVRDVFRSVANKYDLMNDLMSFGIHRIWKRIALEQSGVKLGDNVLDLAGGTGDLSKLFSKRVGKHGSVTLADINEQMLQVGRDRLFDAGILDNVQFAQADAQSLPFKDNEFDCVIIGFGLRNVTDKNKALRSIHRILKPGGRLLVLEFSKPKNPLLKKAYRAYSFNIVPKLGQWITGDKDSYQYLVESIEMHPNQEDLKTQMEAAGFKKVNYHNLTGGIVALHIGDKHHD